MPPLKPNLCIFYHKPQFLNRSFSWPRYSLLHINFGFAALCRQCGEAAGEYRATGGMLFGAGYDPAPPNYV